MRLALDATPLLGQRSGVGRYVEGLLSGLAALDSPPPLLAVFSLRGELPEAFGEPVHRRAPARILQRLWGRFDSPPVEWLTGNIDVFHATNFVLPPRRRAAGVLSIHDLTYLRYPETVTPQVLRYRELVPRGLRSAARVITGSPSVAEEIVAEYRIEPGLVVVAPNGVDPSWAASRPASEGRLAALGLPHRFLLFVGSVEPRKNLPMLLEAHRRARSENPHVPPLVLAGPAGWGEPLSLDRTDVVRAGFLSQSDLQAVVAAAEAVAVPSLYEGFGLPVVEAMASRTPVIASRVPALTEVVGGTGTMVDATDVDGWAHALIIASTSRDPDQIARASERAAEYTWKRTASIHLMAYGEVCSG